MKYFLSIFLLFLGSVCLAESFGMLPVPAFKLAVPYPKSWQHNINMGMGGSFVTLDFTQNKDDEKSPSVFFVAAKTTQMVQMGMAGIGGGLRGMKGLPSVPGVGGRWSGTQAPPARSGESPSSPASAGQNGEGASPSPPQNLPPSNKTIVWLGQKVEQIDGSETLEDGSVMKTRGVTAMLGDKNVTMTCSAPAEQFTPQFLALCDRLIKGVKRIR